jgi:hypothetical protein
LYRDTPRRLAFCSPSSPYKSLLNAPLPAARIVARSRGLSGLLNAPLPAARIVARSRGLSGLLNAPLPAARIVAR